MSSQIPLLSCITEKMNINEDQFRKTLGLFPTGVTVVTTPHGYDDIALTISSFTSVSLNPFQILFCLSKQSRKASAFIESIHFAVNILNAQQAHISDEFAKRLPETNSHLKTFRDSETGCLLFSEALGHVICEKGAIYDGGDHHIILGRVIALRANFEELPLVRQRGRYMTTQDLIADSLQKVS